MTKTVQPSSQASLSETDKDLNIHKPETENNKNLLLSLFDDMNELQEMLNRLDYLLERKIIEQNISRKSKGGKNGD